MTDGKKIAKLLCGACPANGRTVLAVLVDTANGAALHARLRRPGQDARIIAKPTAVVDHYEGVLLRDMPTPSVRSGWYEGEAPPVASIGCRRHGWGAITSDDLRAIEAEYRATGKVVTKVLDIHH